MIITVCLNPALDKTMTVDGLNVDGVNRVISTRVDAGGKGINVAKIIKVFGGDPLATGIVGGGSGDFIQHQLSEMEIRHDFVISEHTTRTNLKVIDHLRHTTTEFNEPGAPVTNAFLEKVWKKIDSASSEGDIVVLSGGNPPAMDDGVLADWITKLKNKGIYTALDTAGEPLRRGIQAQPTIIKPNLIELSEMFGEELHYIRDIIAAARQMNQQGVEKVVVSMGSAGALFVTRDQVLRGYGVQVPLGSTVGSGDAMLAAVIHFLQQGCTWEETARWSIATSAANAMCAGSNTPTWEQIQELFQTAEVETLM